MKKEISDSPSDCYDTGQFSFFTHDSNFTKTSNFFRIRSFVIVAESFGWFSVLAKYSSAISKVNGVDLDFMILFFPEHDHTYAGTLIIYILDFRFENFLIESSEQSFEQFGNIVLKLEIDFFEDLNKFILENIEDISPIMTIKNNEQVYGLLQILYLYISFN